jgi:ribosomal protein S12
MNLMDRPRVCFYFECRWLYFWIVTLTALCLAGCNSNKLKTYPVQGQVVFQDGTPVKVGTVETKAVGKTVQATGSIATDGTFTLTTYRPNDGAIAGEHKVVIVQFIPIEDIPNYRPSTMGVVNRKHASYHTSGLTMQVIPEGENKIKLVVAGADPLSPNAKDHGHDEIPKETTSADSAAK